MLFNLFDVNCVLLLLGLNNLSYLKLLAPINIWIFTLLLLFNKWCVFKIFSCSDKLNINSNGILQKIDYFLKGKLSVITELNNSLFRETIT